jgi:hypothetical protein
VTERTIEKARQLSYCRARDAGKNASARSK